MHGNNEQRCLAKPRPRWRLGWLPWTMSEPTPQADHNTPADGRSTPGDSPASASPNARVSLEGMHGTVSVPPHTASFWRQWRAYVGPAILVSVGYMDPGNWGTDLAGGAQFKYGLLWVV